MINNEFITSKNISVEEIQDSIKSEKQHRSFFTKTYKIFIRVLSITPVIGFICSIKIIPAKWLANVSGSAPCAYTRDFFSSTASAIISLLRGRKTTFSGISKRIMESIREPGLQNQYGTCSAISCQNTIESFQWKKELIESANHNIVISGNYCGGKCFDEILLTIESQLEKKPQLKVLLLSSNKFIVPSNYEKIQRLAASYSDRFQLIESLDIWTIGKKAKFSTNHSKILSIDFGKYFILGGSGLEDKYAYNDGLNSEQHIPSSSESGFLKRILPRSFRDQDFVFYNEKGYEGVGGSVHFEALQLGYAWMHYNKTPAKNSVTEKILLDQALDQPQPVINTFIDRFHQHTNLNQNVKTKILFTGPENDYNTFEQELINQFDEAKTRIVINHMYFHPSQKVFDSLVNAANRGIPIKLITNGYSKTAPLGHKAFGPRNRFNYIALKSAVSRDYRKNIEIHEFTAKKTTLHKKVIVVDDTTIAGSSNFGYKSLGPNSDHEINFIAKNPSLADRTLEIVSVDCKEQHAKLISHLPKLTVPELTRVIMHSLNGFLIG